jgi:hypothetical protein
VLETTHAVGRLFGGGPLLGVQYDPEGHAGEEEAAARSDLTKDDYRQEGAEADQVAARAADPGQPLFQKNAGSSGGARRNESGGRRGKGGRAAARRGAAVFLRAGGGGGRRASRNIAPASVMSKQLQRVREGQSFVIIISIYIYSIGITDHGIYFILSFFSVVHEDDAQRIFS